MYVPTFPMFIQLLDDNIVCLPALALIAVLRVDNPGNFKRLNQSADCRCI